MLNVMNLIMLNYNLNVYYLSKSCHKWKFKTKVQSLFVQSNNNCTGNFGKKYFVHILCTKFNFEVRMS